MFPQKKQARSLGDRGIRPKTRVLRVLRVAGEPGAGGIKEITVKKKKTSKHFQIHLLLIHLPLRFLPQRPRDRCPFLWTRQRGAARVVLALKQPSPRQLRALLWEPTMLLLLQRLGRGTKRGTSLHHLRKENLYRSPCRKQDQVLWAQWRRGRFRRKPPSRKARNRQCQPNCLPLV